MHSLWSIAPWVLLILGTFTFTVILRRQRRALAEAKTTLQRTQQAITRERQLAEDAARAKRLDSLSMMAGRIAHDFSNQITVMMGYVDLALVAPGLAPTVQAHLERIEQVTAHTRDLTQQLKAFAKGESPVKRNVALAPLLREAVELTLADPSIVKRCDLAGELPLVMADEGQIRQVINHLVTNAAQAMSKGGTLTVTGRTIEATDSATAGLASGRWVRLSVTDTGEGIPPENLPRVFEPFFTTKEGGTGMGLATCFSIVAKHGGHLRFESTHKKGTTFHVFLPAM